MAAKGGGGSCGAQPQICLKDLGLGQAEPLEFKRPADAGARAYFPHLPHVALPYSHRVCLKRQTGLRQTCGACPLAVKAVQGERGKQGKGGKWG